MNNIKINNMDLTKFNVNYYNTIGKCVLSVEMSNVPEYCDTLGYEILNSINNHYAYKDFSDGVYSTKPINLLSSIIHFADIMTIGSLYSIESIKKYLESIDIECLKGNYEICNDVCSPLHDKFKENFNKLHNNEGFYSETIYIRENMMEDSPTEYNVWSRIWKPFQNNIIKYVFHTNSKDIKNNLSKGNRSLDIHYHYGVAFLNMYHKIDDDDVSEFVEIKEEDNKFIKFVSPDRQSELYDHLDSHDVNPVFSGRVIPLKEDFDDTDLERTITMYVWYNRPIKTKDGLFKFDLINDDSNLWNKLITE